MDRAQSEPQIGRVLNRWTNRRHVGPVPCHPMAPSDRYDAPGHIPSNHWVMQDRLEMYDLQMKMNVVFPASGIYHFVFVLNGDEVTRQRFHVKSAERPDLEVNDER